MKITKRQINKILREASFNPNELGPIKIIADVGDANYYMKRAQEYLILASNSPTKEQREVYLYLALKLIALALVCNENI